MLSDIPHNIAQAFSRRERRLTVNSTDFFIFNIFLFTHGGYVVHLEREDIFIGNGINNGIGVELIAKRLLGGFKISSAASAGIFRKDRCAGKSKQMVVFECFGDTGVHIAKLAAVALIKDNHIMITKNLVSFVFLDKTVQLLDGGDDDFCVWVFKLFGEYSGAGVAVCRPFFKLVILAHGLIIEVFSVHHKQHLVDMRQPACQLCCFKAGQRFARACGVPDVTTRF